MLSLFTVKKPGRNRKGEMQRLSSVIRGQQIAEYLGCKFNPVDNFDDDICIYIKPNNLDVFFPKKSYIDVVDCLGVAKLIFVKSTKLPVIVCSQSSLNYFKKRCDNKLILIPQHHCNYNNEKRISIEVKKVGIIGSSFEFKYPIEELKEKFKNVGLDLVCNFCYSTREEVVSFYKNIDIQISWYPSYHPLKNSLKIINAGSFGIPTVAYKHERYAEVEGAYVAVKNIDELIEECLNLKNDENYYDDISGKILKISEDYHISKMAKLYKELDS